MEFNHLLNLIKSLKAASYKQKDWGMDRIYTHPEGHDVYSFTFKDKPNSDIKNIIHVMYKSKC